MSSPGGDVGVVLAAAGSGRRFGERKQLLKLSGRPLLVHSLEVFLGIEDVASVVIVAPRDDPDPVEGMVEEALRLHGGPVPAVKVVPGGARRQDSVLEGLRALPPGCGLALVHDAARPLLRAKDVRTLIEAIREHGAAVLGHPATDSVKVAREDLVLRNLPRDSIWLVQTPQGAFAEVLRQAIERAVEQGFEGTDEASFLEWAGLDVALVEGARDNLKITYPADLPLAEFLLSRRGSRGGAEAEREGQRTVDRADGEDYPVRTS